MTESVESVELLKTFRVVKRMAVNVLQAGNDNGIEGVCRLFAVSISLSKYNRVYRYFSIGMTEGHFSVRMC